MPQTQSDFPFTVVGIGASAGGLKAFEAFFTALTPPPDDMAFVIIQHLSPDYESHLSEILSAYTDMPVKTITDEIEIVPGEVYVIPPRHHVELHGHKLLLTTVDEQAPTRFTTISNFFRSLAEARWEQAVAIILSGTGSDGVAGISYIKQNEGMTMAQSPASAKYEQMPQNAINSGNIDIIAPPAELPMLLSEHVNNQQVTWHLASTSEQDTVLLKRIFRTMHKHTGHDFTLYKDTTILRRVSRRMIILNMDSLQAYSHYLQSHDDERDTLFQDLLIGVTRFFRDSFIYDSLLQHAIPALAQKSLESRPIRVWVSGCSTGEEAYSMAIFLYEHLQLSDNNQELQIFATDINPESITFARQGIYRKAVAQDIPPDYLEKYFIETPAGYQIQTHIRKFIVFAVHNVLKDPPFSNLDFISFRNVLIYFQHEAQRHVFAILRYALHTDGFLLLGTSETLGVDGKHFKVLDSKAKLYRLQERASKTQTTFDLAHNEIHTTRNKEYANVSDKQTDLKPIIENLLLRDFVPACVITDTDGNILYFHNRTGKYLEPARGKANFNVMQMAREGLEMPLTTAFRQAITNQQDVRYDHLEVLTNGDAQVINLIIHLIRTPEVLDGLVLILFQDIPDTPTSGFNQDDLAIDDEAQKYITKLERELQTTKEFLQTTLEELETSNEELKSTNEELQSANEELQSTNEELETSKEEVNSVNEELMSANTELQSKIEGFARANNDLQNILNSIDVGIIFLDNDLKIQRFNPTIERLFNIIDADIGRSITHITSNFTQVNLKNDIQGVLDTLTARTIEISLTAENAETWFIMTIRPYRTIEHVIDGVVITFKDISEQKQAHARLNKQQAYASTIINTIRHPFLVLNNAYRIISSNEAFFDLFNVTREETINETFFDINGRQWQIPELRILLERLITQRINIDDFIIERDFPVVGRKKLILNARMLDYEQDDEPLILLAVEDIS